MRSEGDFIKINEWLTPLSWLYGAVVWLRNEFFELGILRSRSYKIPVISVGNITVGGSGKTPHVEYLVRLLQDKLKVAVLSRGYKRKSRGYVLGEMDTEMKQIGDEPYQMRKKFPDIYVAVDRDRRHGIECLTTDEATKDVDVILLDDAFQHRYVKPGISILLVDYHRLIIYDKLLPAGRLREPKEGKARADIVIITKCPKDLKPMEYRVLTKAMKLYPFQGLYFTTLDYCDLKAIFHDEEKELSQLKEQNILLLTGIASPEQMMTDLTPYCKSITPLTFPDHHHFKPKDIIRINEEFEKLPQPGIIVTTEKDATRLQQVQGLSENVRKALYVLPIKISFMHEQEENFNHKIISYVLKNSKNSTLTKELRDFQMKPKEKEHTEEKKHMISFREN